MNEYWSKRKRKNDFENGFFLIWWIMHFLEKLVTINRRRIYLVLEPNYHATKFFSKNLLAIEMKKNKDMYEYTCLFRAFNTRIK